MASSRRVLGSALLKVGFATKRAQDVGGRVLTNDPTLNVRLALEGVGLTLADESRSREGIRSGALVAVLEEFSTPFPGFYLYHPQRRLASAALRGLVDYLRRARQR